MATDIMAIASTPLYCTHTVRKAKYPPAGHSVSASRYRPLNPKTKPQKTQATRFIVEPPIVRLALGSVYSVRLKGR